MQPQAFPYESSLRLLKIHASPGQGKSLSLHRLKSTARESTSYKTLGSNQLRM